MTTTMTAAGHDKVATILERSVCLTLRCRYFGNSRTVALSRVVEAADGTQGKVQQVTATKRILDPKELTAAFREQERARTYLKQVAIPAHRVFGDRTYLVPLALVKEVDARLADIKAAVAAESFMLAGRYEAAMKRQRDVLGPLFDERDYRPAAEVAVAFDIDWSYVSFAAPERLETVDTALFEAARAKYDSQIGEAYTEVRLALREGLRQVMAELAQRLTPDSSGKRKGLRGTALNDLKQFLETFRLRDITDDAEMAAVVSKVQDMMAGVDVNGLRDSDDLRAYVAAQAAAVTEHLDELVVPLTRAIRFDA